jgi:putative ABC transport system substrate-binding protein
MIVWRRAAVAAAIALGLLGAPRLAEAQSTGITVFRIAYLTADSLRATICGRDPTNPAFLGLRDGLRELGYVEGVQIAIECRSAEGQYDRLPALARELLDARPHVIVASAAPASLAVKAATTTVPIVSVYTADPVGLGIVSNMARPGGNVTGISALAADYVAKSLQLLNETAPQATRIAVLGHRPNPTFAVYRRLLDPAASTLGVRLDYREMHSVPDIENQIAAVARSGIGAVLVMHQPFTFTPQNRTLFVEALGKRRLPAMFGSREAVEAGGLMSYAVSVVEVFRRSAVYVDKILKGARPGDLPVEQPTKFELAVNRKTARTLGISIPASVLARAEWVIE